jgi:hypothetical protein
MTVPEEDQRTRLLMGLLDVVERSLAYTCGQLTPKGVDELMERVGKVRYREQFRV